VETRERAQELLDEVSRRGQEAREASASATTRLVEAIQQMRLVSREDLREVKDAVERLAKRVEALESARRAPNQQGEPDSKVEG
jgi:polyhydroxyalkanoate synthesis regulator phasin